MGNPYITEIIFFVSSTFNQRDKKRFGIELLQANGFKVQVWDFTPFLNPEKYNTYIPPDRTDENQYPVFKSKQEAIDAIAHLPSGCLVFCLLSYESSFGIYRAISKYKIPYCLLGYSVPAFNSIENRSFFKRLRDMSLGKIFNYLLFKTPSRLLGVQPATMLFALGGQFNLLQFNIDSRTQIIRSHYFDYDIYLEAIQEPVKADPLMGVFLDNYLPFHPDSLDELDEPLITPEEYYPLLCRFFDQIEKEHGVHIVIAAHPRSEYDLHPDCFEGRRIIRGKTAELVRQSGFVMLHSSASIAFAVLFRKPVLFLSADRLYQGMAGKIIGSLIDYMAPLFGKKPIRMDNPGELNWEKELVVDQEAYQFYQNRYIKTEGTEDLPLWQVFANHLKKWNPGNKPS